MANPSNFITRAEQWLRDPPVFRGLWEGGGRGAGISVIANQMTAVGRGIRLHRHPYTEVFVIRAGRALFAIDGVEIEAKAGEVVVAPAGSAHKFTNLGPQTLETINIHENGSFETEWLE